MKKLIKIYVFAGISLLLISCGTTARLPNQGNVKSPVNMPNYIIKLADENDWEDWEMEISEGNLFFQRLRPLPTSGKIVAISMMEVMVDTLEASLHNLPKEQIIDTLVDKHLNYWQIFADTLDGELEDVNISTIQQKDKNLSVLEMKLIRSSAWSLSFTVEWNYEIATYFYFPETNFSDQCFYLFQMVEHYQPGTYLPIDMEPILEIIDGFELKK